MRSGSRSSNLVLVGFVLDHLDIFTDKIRRVVRSGTVVTVSPDYRTPSRRIHSRYQRRAADLSLSGRRVELQILVRRFRSNASASPP